jgi:hypothetical protein
VLEVVAVVVGADVLEVVAVVVGADVLEVVAVVVGAEVLDVVGAGGDVEVEVVGAGAGDGVEEVEAGTDELPVFAGESAAEVTALGTGAVALETAPVTPETREGGSSADALAAEIRPVPTAIVMTAMAISNLKGTLSMRGLCTRSDESHKRFEEKFPH